MACVGMRAWLKHTATYPFKPVTEPENPRWPWVKAHILIDGQRQMHDSNMINLKKIMKHIQIGYAGMSPLIFLLPPPRLDPQELEIDHGFDHITFHIFSPSWLSTWCSNKTPEPVMTNLLPRHDHSNPQIHHVHLRLGYPNRQPSWPKSTWAACRCFMMLVDLGMLDESVSYVYGWAPYMGYP